LTQIVSLIFAVVLEEQSARWLSVYHPVHDNAHIGHSDSLLLVLVQDFAAAAATVAAACICCFATLLYNEVAVTGL
jgi:hypothetical protein